MDDPTVAVPATRSSSWRQEFCSMAVHRARDKAPGQRRGPVQIEDEVSNA